MCSICSGLSEELTVVSAVIVALADEARIQSINMLEDMIDFMFLSYLLLLLTIIIPAIAVTKIVAARPIAAGATILYFNV